MITSDQPPKTETAVKNDKVRILVVEDHGIVQTALRNLIENRAEWEVCDAVADGREALAAIERNKPQVVILDLTLPGLDGIKVAQQIAETYPEIGVVVFSGSANENLIRGAFAAKARAYVFKSDSELIPAIEAALRKGYYLSASVSTIVVEGIICAKTEQVEGASILTPREREVLALVANGRSNKETASKLGISVKTVDTHRANLMQKLGLHSTAELVHYAIREGIVEP